MTKEFCFKHPDGTAVIITTPNKTSYKVAKKLYDNFLKEIKNL